jgi:hypothetical protein
MPDSRSGRSVVLAPGGNNSAQIPLLMYSRLAAQRRGASVEVVSVLGQVLTAVEEFLDHAVWPMPTD